MLRKRTILITGGGSGIGEALALQLAPHNRIIICGRNEEKLKKVCSTNSNIAYIVADISDYHSIEKLFKALQEKSVVPDVLINNAGVVEVWDLAKSKLTSKEIFEKINTNLSGAIAVTQHFINVADPNVENLIINNTSEIALMPIPVLPLYSASKAALSVFTRALRMQLKDTNFKVVEWLPPSVDTDMPRKLNNKGKLLDRHEFARNAINSVEKGNSEYAPGPNAMLFKIFQRIAPKMGLHLIDNLSRKQLG